MTALQPALVQTHRGCFRSGLAPARSPTAVRRCSTVTPCAAVRQEADGGRRDVQLVERAGRQDESAAVYVRLVAAAASAAVLLAAPSALAVSGGGGLGNDMDFADNTGKDYSGGQFYKVNMRQTIWKDANLSRANLFGSFAKGADFSGADLTNADLESVDFANADLSNALLIEVETSGAQFRALKSIEGSDWTDTLLRKDQKNYLCSIAKGTNPKTGVDTRESLGCPPL